MSGNGTNGGGISSNTHGQAQLVSSKKSRKSSPRNGSHDSLTSGQDNQLKQEIAITEQLTSTMVRQYQKPHTRSSKPLPPPSSVEAQRSTEPRHKTTEGSCSPTNVTGEAEPNDLQSEYGKMSQAIETLLQRMEQIKKDVGQMQNRLKKNSKSYADTKARLRRVDEQAISLRAQLEEQSDLCRAEYGTLSQHVLQLQSISDLDIGDLKDKVSTMQMQWTDQQQQLTGIRRQLAYGAVANMSWPQRAVHDTTGLVGSGASLVWWLCVRAYNFVVRHTSGATGGVL